MKNKDKFDWEKFSIHSACILLLLMAISFLYILINGFDFNKFLIYKEECRDETSQSNLWENIQIKHPDTNVSNNGERTILNFTIVDYNLADRCVLYDYGLILYFDTTREIREYMNYSEFKESKVYLSADNFTIFNDNFCYDIEIEILDIKNLSSTQICENKSVDALVEKGCKLIYFRYGNNLYTQVDYETNLSMILCVEVTDSDTKIIGLDKKTISKSDLTIEWLEENCELKRCTACEDLRCKNQKCDLFKCGDYFVEKLK